MITPKLNTTVHGGRLVSKDWSWVLLFTGLHRDIY